MKFKSQHWNFPEIAKAIALSLLITLMMVNNSALAATSEVLPIPFPEFNGKIGLTYKDSQPDFPQPITAPAKAPNVLLVILDDVGFGQASTFGGPVDTPNLTRLAARGLRYNQFHTTALCSPTRAALLTGRNHHSVNTGVVEELATGYPGYTTILPKSAATVAEILRQNGYNTAAFGKWHNTPDFETSVAGPFDRWPTGLGFEYFYGFLGGDTNQWSPALVENTKRVDKPNQPDYHLTPDLVDHAIAELNSLSAFQGPKQNGVVTPQTLFRGNVIYVDERDRSGRTAKYVTPPGVLDGPYISQFLLREIPYNTQVISPLIRTALAGRDNDFLTNYDEWLTVQNGGSSGSAIRYDPTRRFVYTVRDLGELAHIGGALFFGASLILGGINAPLNPGNPYINSRTQVGSAATFAPAHFQALLNLAPSRAIRVSYWQKYYVHRRLRPEAYGGLIHNNFVNGTNHPINSEVLRSTALARTFSNFGTYLLPHAYPEGAPFHSSYTGGAASIAGVQATLLKAFFDENFIIPNPVEPDPNDPTKLIPYSGTPLTVGGELNKLATNYYIGRGHGGIHWRSDGAAGLALGEEVAISILRDERLGYNERFNGFTFTKFDGTKITV